MIITPHMQECFPGYPVYQATGYGNLYTLRHFKKKCKKYVRYNYYIAMNRYIMANIHTDVPRNPCMQSISASKTSS